MPVRVELIDDAVDDLLRYAETGNLPLFLKKLIRLDEVGKDVGRPLGGKLAGWRKIVVGDRDWRIIFTTNPEDTIATVWVIGDRSDAECYDEAQKRIREVGKGEPQVASLATVVFQLSEMQKAARRVKRRKS